MNPHELAEKRVRLSGEYSRDSEELGNILADKPALWMKLRENTKSDKSADRVWDSTLLGVQEMKLRLKLKASEKEMSAIKTMLDVLNGEAWNQY